MSLDHMQQFVITFFLGISLFIAGGINLLLRRSSQHLRGLLAASLLSSTFFGLSQVFDNLVFLWGSVVLVTGSCVLYGMGQSSWFSNYSQKYRAKYGGPNLLWATICLLGLCSVVGATVHYQIADEAWITAQSEDLQDQAYIPELAEVFTDEAITDQGTHVPLKKPLLIRDALTMKGREKAFLSSTNLTDPKLIARQPADDESNCHGWVFTDGRYWIGGETVQLILQENGYEETSQPQPGDLAVYRNYDQITHTALVRYVTPGMPVMVEGKWGALGVYLHPSDHSCYGTCRFYSSCRTGHLLQGFTKPTSDATGPVLFGVSE